MSTHDPAPSPGRVRLRDVTEDDLPVFFDHQRDPEANRVASFPARDRDAFMAHWTRILGDETVISKTILLDDHVAGNVVSFDRSGERQVGYWIGRNHWGKGVATRGLSAFLGHETARPLHAHVAKDNIGSIRVLEKCGFAIAAGVALPGEPEDGVEELVLKLDR